MTEREAKIIFLRAMRTKLNTYSPKVTKIAPESHGHYISRTIPK